MDFIDTAIIGAGPYGLSLAAHLRAENVPFRVFGRAMASWRDHMLPLTTLKSLGFASNLYNAGSPFTLERFCIESEFRYAEASGSIPIGIFAAYGQEFQRRFVSTLEEVNIAGLERSSAGFRVTTTEGEVLQARRVVLAVGITHFGYVPLIFQELSSDRVSHSSQHSDLEQFRDKRVAVIGGGASATDLAAQLQEKGHEVHLFARRRSIDFQSPTVLERTVLTRMRKPRSGLGDGWRGRLCANHPLLFHTLPSNLRHSTVRRVNGPSAVWTTREKLIGNVTMHLGTTIRGATEAADSVTLQLATPERSYDLSFDHVIAATGYRVALNRIPFLCHQLAQEIVTKHESPVLTKNFETSIPGLHMVGLASAQSFGPLCRFAYGAKFTSDRLSRYLARTSHRKSA